jgi:hypothetical protein
MAGIGQKPAPGMTPDDVHFRGKQRRRLGPPLDSEQLMVLKHAQWLAAPFYKNYGPMRHKTGLALRIKSRTPSGARLAISLKTGMPPLDQLGRALAGKFARWGVAVRPVRRLARRIAVPRKARAAH